MMRHFPTSAIALLALSSLAAAQTPATDPALLKAPQKINQRLDHMQKEIDQLKVATPAAVATSPTMAAPPAPRKPVAGETVTIPGWKVDVVPADNDTKDPVASFNWDKPEFNFGLHTKLVGGHNPYIYRGTGTFYPDQKARYVFQLTLNPLRTANGYPFRCAGNIKIGGELVAEGKANAVNASGPFDRNNEAFVPATFSGGTELEPPTDPKKGYVLTFEVSCYYDEQDHAQLMDMLFKPWQDNRFSILVKGPDDASGRALAGNELYHAGKVKTAR